MTVHGMIRMRVYGTPKPQGSKVAYMVGGHARITEHDPAKLKAQWRNDVSLAARTALEGGLVDPFVDGVPLRVALTFWMPKPASRPKRRQSWPTVAPDLDKLARSTLDACTAAGLWHDDAQIVDLHVRKVYVDAEHPEPGVLLEADALLDWVCQPRFAL